jgi:hypothetical protein
MPGLGLVWPKSMFDFIFSCYFTIFFWRYCSIFSTRVKVDSKFKNVLLNSCHNFLDKIRRCSLRNVCRFRNTNFRESPITASAQTKIKFAPSPAARRWMHPPRRGAVWTCLRARLRLTTIFYWSYPWAPPVVVVIEDDDQRPWRRSSGIGSISRKYQQIILRRAVGLSLMQSVNRIMAAKFVCAARYVRPLEIPSVQ